MKFNINNRKNWKIHKTVEIKQCNSIKESTKKIRKYLHMNENKNTTQQNLWDPEKAVLSRKFIGINTFQKKKKDFKSTT